jgi:hypothetical protein
MHELIMMIGVLLIEELAHDEVIFEVFPFTPEDRNVRAEIVQRHAFKAIPRHRSPVGIEMKPTHLQHIMEGVVANPDVRDMPLIEKGTQLAISVLLGKQRIKDHERTTRQL